MNWGLLNGAMLAGLAGVAIPVVLHFLNRRRTEVVDWGAMQFLDLGRRARQKFQVTELLLMVGRMLLLTLVALALGRPFWTAKEPQARAGPIGTAALGSGTRRDVVLILDGSASMGRRIGGSTPRDLALTWARRFVSGLGAGDSVAVLVARDRVKPLLSPPSFDRSRVEAALGQAPPPLGASDLPAALAEAYHLLEAPGNPARDIIVLSDGQRFAWRPDEPARWSILREISRDLSRRSGITPRVWALRFGDPAVANGANASVAPLELSRGLITPDLPITVTTTVANSGPGPLTRDAELVLDGDPVPGLTQTIGPIPAGGQAPLRFSIAIPRPGSHALAVRLAGDPDALPGDDEAARAVEVTPALPVLLVEGKPAVEPFSGGTDFLRAALAPAEAESRQIQARVVRLDAFAPADLDRVRVVVLAGVEGLNPPLVSAVKRFVERGGGVLLLPPIGPDAATSFVGGDAWLPAKWGPVRGEPSRHERVARPAPRTFTGPALTPFARGDDPPLGLASLFGYRPLNPMPGASVTARLDTGDPWIVERPFGKGRAAVLAGPVDAGGGTFPVNPDFVPWAHELVFHLADAGAGARASRPGEPLTVTLDPPPLASVATVAVKTPDGSTARAAVDRAEGISVARLESADDPGLYRFDWPEPEGGSAFATVVADARELDLRPLETGEAESLARDWPLRFDATPDRLAGRLLASETPARAELWRPLILAALAGLCLEVWMTRRLVKNRGFAVVAD